MQQTDIPRPLTRSPLSSEERETLLRLTEDLARYLGSPGDWGYGTKLGDLTIYLTRLRVEIAESQ